MKLTIWIFKIYTAARIYDLYHAYLQEIDFADRLQTVQNCLADLGVIEFQDEEPDISEL